MAWFDWFRRGKQGVEASADPLAAFDGLIESIDRQAAQVRRSAATLLALRGELTRDRDRSQQRSDEIGERLKVAQAQGDARAERTLTGDLADARELFEQAGRALDSANEDATVLLQTAEELARRAHQLRSERLSAHARLSTGRVVSAALQHQTEEFDKVMAVDAARDEVERARALADIYRDESTGRGPR